jgi:hypothetical protein
MGPGQGGLDVPSSMVDGSNELVGADVASEVTLGWLTGISLGPTTGPGWIGVMGTGGATGGRSGCGA